MEAKSVLLLLIVVAVLGAPNVSAGRSININRQTDKAILILDRILAEKGLGLIQTRNFWGETRVMLGLNSLLRTGDCWLRYLGSGTEAFDFSLGYRLLVLAEGIARHENDVMSGLIRSRGNVLRLSFAVRNNTRGCEVSVRELKMADLGTVIVYSSLEKYDETDISSFAREKFLPAINEHLVERVRPLEWILQEWICRKRIRARLGLEDILINDEDSNESTFSPEVEDQSTADPLPKVNVI